MSDIDPLVLSSLFPTWAPGDGVIVGFEDLDALDPAFDSDFNDLVFSFRNVTTAVPEPTTLLLISTGAVGLLARSRRKNRKKQGLLRRTKGETAPFDPLIGLDWMRVSAQSRTTLSSRAITTCVSFDPADGLKAVAPQPLRPKARLACARRQ